MVSHVVKKLSEIERQIHPMYVPLNILPRCFLLLHRDQKVGQAADLADAKTEEKENQQQTDSQPDKQRDPYNDRGKQAEPEQNELAHTAIPNGASLARTGNHSSDTHNICTWVQRSWGPNRMLMLSWCREVEGGRIPDEL